MRKKISTQDADNIIEALAKKFGVEAKDIPKDQQYYLRESIKHLAQYGTLPEKSDITPKYEEYLEDGVFEFCELFGVNHQNITPDELEHLKDVLSCEFVTINNLKHLIAKERNVEYSDKSAKALINRYHLSHIEYTPDSSTYEHGHYEFKSTRNLRHNTLLKICDEFGIDIETLSGKQIQKIHHLLQSSMTFTSDFEKFLSIENIAHTKPAPKHRCYINEFDDLKACRPKKTPDSVVCPALSLPPENLGDDSAFEYKW